MGFTVSNGNVFIGIEHPQMLCLRVAVSYGSIGA